LNERQFVEERERHDNILTGRQQRQEGEGRSAPRKYSRRKIRDVSIIIERGRGDQRGRNKEDGEDERAKKGVKGNEKRRKS
jgi:hypothetical protein